MVARVEAVYEPDGNVSKAIVVCPEHEVQAVVLFGADGEVKVIVEPVGSWRGKDGPQMPRYVLSALNSDRRRAIVEIIALEPDDESLPGA